MIFTLTKVIVFNKHGRGLFCKQVGASKCNRGLCEFEHCLSYGFYSAKRWVQRESVKEKEVLKRGAEHEGASSIVVPRNKVLFNLTQEMNAALYQLSVPSLHHCSPSDCIVSSFNLYLKLICVKNFLIFCCYYYSFLT